MVVKGKELSSNHYLLRKGSSTDVGTFHVHFVEHYSRIKNCSYVDIVKMTVDSGVSLDGATITGTITVNGEVVVNMLGDSWHLQLVDGEYIVVGPDQYPISCPDVVHTDTRFMDIRDDLTIVSTTSYTMVSQGGMSQGLELTPLNHQGALNAFMYGVSVGMGLSGNCDTQQGDGHG